jgi:hypothetical protein
MAKKKVITPEQADEVVDSIPEPISQVENPTLTQEEIDNIALKASKGIPEPNSGEIIDPESLSQHIDDDIKPTDEKPEEVKPIKTKLYCFKYTGPVRSYTTHFDIDRHDCLIECVDSVVQTDDPILGEYIKQRIKDLGMEEIK